MRWSQTWYTSQGSGVVSSVGLLLSFAWTCLSSGLECKSAAGAVGGTYSAPAYAHIWTPGLVSGSCMHVTSLIPVVVVVICSRLQHGVMQNSHIGSNNLLTSISVWEGQHINSSTASAGLRLYLDHACKPLTQSPCLLSHYQALSDAPDKHTPLKACLSTLTDTK